MSVASRVYAALPTWGQHLAVSAYGLYWRRLRFGPGYDTHLARFRDRERWNAERWQGWLDAELRSLLAEAAERVPFYRGSWTAAEKKAAGEGRLDGLPLLEKEPLRRDPRAFVRDGPREREHVFPTSGSTGTPILSLWTTDELRASLALREARSANWAGTSFTRPRATFSGRIVVPDPASRGPFHRFNRVEKQVYFSVFHLAPKNVSQYLDALRHHRVEWLTGYAVSSALLARFVLDAGLEAPSLRAVVTTSEKLTSPMRHDLEKAFGATVREEYSTVENAVFASECEAGRLHVSPDAGIVEILRPDGSPAPAGETGEVVATCLLRRHQPLVRFRLGDLAAWAAEPCPCGRAMPVLQEVVGRIEDVVVGPDGRSLVRFHGIFVELPAVREGQVVQEAIDHLVIKIVAAPTFTSDDENEIRRRVGQRMGAGVRVDVERVASIPRTAAGKLQAVVSRLESHSGFPDDRR